MGLALKKQDDSNRQFALVDYRKRLPKKPYACDAFEENKIQALARALLRHHIQHNPPQWAQVLAFDIDKAPGALAADFAGLPAPNFAVINPANERAHLFYALAEPVYLGDGSSPKAINYLEAVRAGMLARLMPHGADPMYAGLLAKNPYSPHWRTVVMNQGLYALDTLAKWSGYENYLNPYKRRQHRHHDRAQAVAVGRNATLFYDLRHWAYKAIRQGYPAFDQWYTACLHRAMMINTSNAAEFGGTKLDPREVAHVARSVAVWTHRKMTAAEFTRYVDRTHTPELQAKRGKRNTAEAQAAKGRAKGEAYNQQRTEALALVAQGMSQAEAADRVGVSRATVNRWAKAARRDV